MHLNLVLIYSLVLNKVFSLKLLLSYCKLLAQFFNYPLFLCNYLLRSLLRN